MVIVAACGAQPGVHGVGQQQVERRLPVCAARVALEEQSLEGAHRGIAELCPDLRHSIRRAPVECCDALRLSGFDLADDRQEQLFPRPEVV